MTQTRVAPDTWQFARETIDLIPLTVDIDLVPTTSYTISVVPAGTRPVTYTAPTTAGTRTGYLVNGPVLGVGVYIGYVKITSSPEVPVRLAFILYLV